MPRCPVDPANPSNASTRMVGGKAVFENDSYRITAGDDNQVLIQNKHTGETYRAWGDPHMEIDGKHAFDFWGTTTFMLDDGTKVTIETTPWGNNPEATLSSKVTITNGDYGVQITGVDTNTRGDLAIDEGKGWGRLADWAVDDGNVLYENRLGSGFVAIDEQGRLRKVDQQYIHETDLLKGGKLTERHRDAFQALTGIVSIAFVGAFLGTMAALGMVADRLDRPDRQRPQPLPNPFPRFDPTPIGIMPVMPPMVLALTLARWAPQMG
jgi:hypothetical protein